VTSLRKAPTVSDRAEGTSDHYLLPSDFRLLPELKARGACTALDLGCGAGRDALK